MAPPVSDVDVFVGVDMAKEDHFAQAISRDGTDCSAERSATTKPRSNNSSPTPAPTGASL